MIYESQSYRVESHDGITDIWFDFRGRTSHSFTLASLNELSLVLDRLEKLPAPHVVVLRSSKPDEFVDDFDLGELSKLSSPLEFAAFARRGQDVARKLAGLRAPTVALIEGRCAGAGLELALACAHRIAVDHLATHFQHSHVARGLVPCWGGSYRLPRLIGLRAAREFLTSNSQMSAVAAYEIGLVDRLFSTSRRHVDVRAFVDRVRDYLLRRKRRSLARTLLDLPERWRLHHELSAAPGDESTPRSEFLRAMVAGLSSEGEALSAERTAVSRLAETQHIQLVALDARAANPTRCAAEPPNPIPVLPRRIGIVGGGEVGMHLATKLARHGHEVIVQEQDTVEATKFSRSINARMTQFVRTREMSRASAAALASAIRVTTEWSGFDNADLVIEAVPDDPGIKRNVFQELENRVRPRVILATSTSTLSVESLQAEMSRPGRVIGFHLPNFSGSRPVAELVATPLTSAGTSAALSRWARIWDFVPIHVADRPGRLVNLVRATYLSEGVRLVAEGLPIEQIDAALRQFGMESGPLEWCDQRGLDRIANEIAHLQMARGDHFARNLLFQRLLGCRLIGRATEEGFYRYAPSRRPSQLARMLLWQDLDEGLPTHYVFDPDQAMKEGIERLLLRTLNEAAAAVADEPDSDPATVDLALVFGMGWAPLRGGPLRYADEIGLSYVVDRLSYYAERSGEDYAPCDELLRRAEAGESFYGVSNAKAMKPARVWRMAG